MAIVYPIRELLDECSLNSQWQRFYKRRFLVKSDDRADGPLIARNATGIPTLGNPYARTPPEVDTGSFVQGVSAKRTKLYRTQSDSGTILGSWFEVDVDYGPYDPTRYPQNPLDWPYKVSIGYQTFDKVIWFDLDGKAVINSAGCRFSDPVTIPNARTLLSITRNEPSFDPVFAKSLNNTRNSTEFLGADPFTVQMPSPTAEQAFNSDIGIYWPVTYIFAFSDEEWSKKILDQGCSELIGGVLKQITNNGQPLQDAVPLDGNGARLAVSGEPVAIEFRVFTDYDFNELAFEDAKLGFAGG